MPKLCIPRLIPALLLAALLSVAATGCGPSEAELAKIKTQGDRYLAQGLDPEGYSKDEVFNLSDREQYELFKKRYERAYEVAGDIMTVAAGSNKEWEVIAYGPPPATGDRGQNPLPRGARPEDTYTFSVTLIAKFDEPIDYQAVVEKMQAWMNEQDYNTSDIGDIGYGPQVNGLTQDGIQTWFAANERNNMLLDVFPGPYWGSSDKLRRLMSLPSDDLFEEFKFILPYEHLPFPEFRGDKTY